MAGDEFINTGLIRRQPQLFKQGAESLFPFPWVVPQSDDKIDLMQRVQQRFNKSTASSDLCIQ